MRYGIDYWPSGRAGGRKLFTLPEGISPEAAKKAEATFKARKSTMAVDMHGATVADLFPDYLSWYKLHRAPTSYKDVSLSWEKTFQKILGSYQVRDISAEHMTIYQQARTGMETVKNRTINKELDYFGGFLKYLRREKKIDIARIDYEKLPSKRPLPTILSAAEVAAIMQAAEREPFYRAFFLCLYALGFRVNEVRLLRVEDFDFASRTVRVRQKGGSEKTLPLSEQVVEAVKDLVELWPMEAGAYLFALKRSGAPVGDVRAAIARTCKRAGVTKKVTPHLFRHSIASHLMGSDVNVSIIQKFLGHSQISTTQWYSHVSMGDLRRAQQLITDGGLYTNPALTRVPGSDSTEKRGTI